MKLNKIKTIVPAAALLLTASLSSCMADLDKGNIDPTVEPNADIIGLYSKCYAGLIMEGNDGNADFTIDDAGKSTLLRNVFNFNELPTDESICWWSDGGITDICKNQCLSGNATLKFLYYRLMSNITFCNQYISLDAAQSEKTMLAEVRFIRAYNYFLMLDFFGDPPFIETISTDAPRQAHTYNKNFDPNKTYNRAELLQLGREFLFNWVKDELVAAEADMLPAKPENDTDASGGNSATLASLTKLMTEKEPNLDAIQEAAGQWINSITSASDQTDNTSLINIRYQGIWNLFPYKMSKKMKEIAREYYKDKKTCINLASIGIAPEQTN